MCVGLPSYAQDSSKSSAALIPGLHEKNDSVRFNEQEPGFQSILESMKGMKKQLLHFDSLSLRLPKSSFNNSIKDQLSVFRKLNNQSRFFAAGNGYISYSFYYRSNIDTPYAEKNIGQHQVLASTGVTVANYIPLRVTAYLRRSNSVVFRDITDVQVQYDAAAFHNQFADNLRNQLLERAGGIKDSLSGKLYDLKKVQLDGLLKWLDDKEIQQKRIEANEILKVEEIAYDKSKPESINRSRTDSLRKLAKAFLDAYDEIVQKYGTIKQQADSLKMIYDNSIRKMKAIQQRISDHQFLSPESYRELMNQAADSGMSRINMPKRFTWLMGLRNFGFGRTNVDATELTARNISLSGVNFEYNSWYYLAVAAGIIDYRYRDFVVGNFHKVPQHMYLIRAGIGRLEKNYVILSYFRGQKQLYNYASNSFPASAIKIEGYSVEAKWQLEKNSYIITEAGQSFAPNLQLLPDVVKNSWRLSEKASKGLSVKLFSYIPGTGSRLEGQYKFTGENYQSFNSFQTNSETVSWKLKAEQNFWNRRIRLQASLGKNEFSNPFIRQNYKSNTVFKSISARVNIRKWPSLSIGYMPMSQLTMVDGYLSESRFQTLNAGIVHFYKIGQAGATTNIVYNRFFNHATDSGFIYFNSINLFAGQSFLFKNFMVNLNISNSRNAGYSYTVLDENTSFPLSEGMSLGMGVKINKLNSEALKVGGQANASFTLFKRDVVSFQVEQTYLPGNKNQLISSVMGNINYTKTFR
jgi:hypothetical protein